MCVLLLSLQGHCAQPASLTFRLKGSKCAALSLSAALLALNAPCGSSPVYYALLAGQRSKWGDWLEDTGKPQCTQPGNIYFAIARHLQSCCFTLGFLRPIGRDEICPTRRLREGFFLFFFLLFVALPHEVTQSSQQRLSSASFLRRVICRSRRLLLLLTAEAAAAVQEQ